MGLSERLYGPTAATYDPERWLGHTAAPSTVGTADDVAAGSADQQKKMHVQQAAAGSKGTPPEPLVFSAGPRDCIGQSLARMELQVVVASLVSRFEFKPGDRLGRAVEAAVARACSTTGTDHSTGVAQEGGAAVQGCTGKLAEGGAGSGHNPSSPGVGPQAAAAVLQGLYDMAEYHMTLQPTGGMWLVAQPRS